MTPNRSDEGRNMIQTAGEGALNIARENMSQATVLA